MQSAGVGGGAPCSDSTKFNIILDNITDTTGQMLRLHEPINDPKWNAGGSIKTVVRKVKKLLVNSATYVKLGTNERMQVI